MSLLGTIDNVGIYRELLRVGFSALLIKRSRTTFTRQAWFSHLAAYTEHVSFVKHINGRV